MGDFLEDDRTDRVEDTVMRSDLSLAVHQMLQDLPERERQILRMRFGIGMNTDHTLEEVASSSMSPGSAFAKSRRRRCGVCAVPTGRVSCTTLWAAVCLRCRRCSAAPPTTTSP